MGERASDTITIGRPAADVMAVITDLETYPEWAEGVTKVEVHSRDDLGRPLDATMFVDAKVFEINYLLRYEYVDDHLITWALVEQEGQQLTKLDGSYALAEVDGTTTVTYALEVDIALPLPGFMKKRGAKVIMATGLKGLRDRVEASDASA